MNGTTKANATPDRHPTERAESPIRKKKSGRRARLLVAAILAMTLSTVALVQPANAATVTGSGSGLQVSYPNVDDCTYKVWWDFSGESKTIKVYGPTATAPAGQTVYYRALLFDTVTKQYVNWTNWATWTMGSSSVRFGDVTFDTGFVGANSVHDLVVRLEFYSFAGVTQKAYYLLQTNYFRQYGGASLGIPQGALSGTC